MSRLGLLFLLALVLALCACALPRAGSAPPQDGAPAAVYLVSHGWHTGLAVRRADIPVGLWPESRDFPEADYLEVGWGDHDFYRSPDPGLWLTLKAALWPTPSALHVVGVRRPLPAYFGASEVIELRLSRAGLERLVRYIHDAHARDDAPAGTPLGSLGPGLYGDSRFYRARETFHLLRTCNVWTARALRTAGLPVRDAITREGLMSQARRLGTVIGPIQLLTPR